MDDKTADTISQKGSFEARVFARFDVLDLNIRDLESSVRSMEARMQKLENRTFDAKPIAEQVLKEVKEARRELSKRLDEFEAAVLKTLADLHVVENLSRKESEPAK